LSCRGQAGARRGQRKTCVGHYEMALLRHFSPVRTYQYPHRPCGNRTSISRHCMFAPVHRAVDNVRFRPGVEINFLPLSQIVDTSLTPNKPGMRPSKSSSSVNSTMKRSFGLPNSSTRMMASIVRGGSSIRSRYRAISPVRASDVNRKESEKLPFVFYRARQSCVNRPPCWTRPGVARI